MFQNLIKQRPATKIYPDLSPLLENASDEITTFPLEPPLKFTDSKTKAPSTQNTLRRNPFQDKDSETQESSSTPYKYITGLLVLLICLLPCIYWNFRRRPLLPQYLKEIETFRADYDQQTEYFWDIIKSFPYEVLSEENPKSPAVLLMVTPASNLASTLILTQQLAYILNNLFKSSPKDFHVIDGTALAAQGPDEQKLIIDKQIRNLVDNRKQSTVIVANLEKIDPLAIMIFHAYCDDSAAVFKDIAIIFILELPVGVHAETMEDVYGHLTNIWRPLGKSRIDPLLSRMANNIAILKVK